MTYSARLRALTGSTWKPRIPSIAEIEWTLGMAIGESGR